MDAGKRLYMAARRCDAGAVGELLSQGTGVKLFFYGPRMDNGMRMWRNALHAAVGRRGEHASLNRKARLETMELLLSGGACANLAMHGGITVMMLAAVCADPVESMGLLLRFGASVNDQTWDGTTALMLAVAWGKLESVEFLLRHGSDWRVRRSDGLTALAGACMVSLDKNAHQGEIVRALLRDGADATMETDTGHTALTIAATCQNQAVTRLLKASLQPWRPGTHGLYPVRFQEAIFQLLLVGARLRPLNLAWLPEELVLMIGGYLLRRDFNLI